MAILQGKKRILVIKKTSFFLFGLALFFIPGPTYYLNLEVHWQPPLIEEVNSQLPHLNAYPVNFTGEKAPSLTAQSALVLDRDSAVVLYQKNGRKRLLPASTVKMMTALVVLDHYQLDEVLTVNGISWEGQDMELQEGEKISVRSLLYGLLVSSANDAAQVLAKNYPGGEKTFLAVMNQKAKELNLSDTYFASVSGLENDNLGFLWPNHSYTSTLDLARLTVGAIKNPVFAQIVATPQVLVADLSGKITHPLYNINQLLGQIEGLKGVKTGWTEEAGECLVSFVERNGRGVVIVILGSEDRFGETASLVEWAFSNYEWQEIITTVPRVDNSIPQSSCFKRNSWMAVTGVT